MSRSRQDTRIKIVHAREVFDSRGQPTVEVEITCDGGRTGSAIVPSGASTGQFEAYELRDNDPARLGGRGVLRAVGHVNDVLARAIYGMDAADQSAIDERLCQIDGTANKSRLGANALLGVSLAAAHAAAAARELSLVEHLHELWLAILPGPSRSSVAATSTTACAPATLGTRLTLPLPMVNMISGGLHAGRNLDFQDFLILPVGARSYRDALTQIVSVYHQLGRLLSTAGFEGVLVGDEGGYGPKLTDNEQALALIVEAIEAAGLAPGRDVALGIDVASTHFYDGTRYNLVAGGQRSVDAAGLVDLLESWVERYPIISIEDGVADDDWAGWELLTRRLGRRVQLIGDDLFVTNAERLRQGIARGVANSVLIKVNQIGTLTETLSTLRTAIDSGYWPVISARSGETEDSTIADLAVATGAGQIKIGSVARSERLAKYNQLLRLEERLASRATYAGGEIFESLRSG
ncbi:MAG: phosphopyruvate hydratase [Planctomycetaceae bacterium]|nr:phosphopyruvate hydratase [Planctomycetaceae bacterium]